MSIDFAKVTGLEIPEGIVTQITDASGRVLWSAIKNVKVTITSQWDGFDGDSASITVKSSKPFVPDPTNPSNKVTSWTVFVYDQPNCTIEVPMGATIECTVSRDKGNADSHITLNGSKMVTGEGTYIYTVTGDVTIAIKELYVQGDYGVITIVEDGLAILEVEKKTLTTYAGETTYDSEQFIMLDIYPKNANSTVEVTYSGLTKTLQFNGTNAQQVYFGTFNGVSDSVTTPASGILTIKGDYVAFGCGNYTPNKTIASYCPCITGVSTFGNVNYIPANAFGGCSYLTLTDLPRGITSIGKNAFNSCININILEIPEGVTTIGDSAFWMPNKNEGSTYNPDYVAYTKMNNATVILPSTIQHIGSKVWGYEGNAMNGNFYISNLVILATNPPEIPTEGLGALDFKITVPKGCAEIYKAAENWHPHSSSIVEAS
jgi:hypothetical protein